LNKTLQDACINLVADYIETYNERTKVYDELNDHIKKVQGDFYSHLELIDSDLSNKLNDRLDEVIETMTGCKEIVSHILYDTGMIEIEGIMYDLKEKEELIKFLNLNNK
jgi:hypothetical protein